MATVKQTQEVENTSALRTRPPEIDYVFKILLIGDSGVGKSGLLLRFTEGLFTDTFNTTIGVEFKFRTIEVDGKAVKLQIWDTSGQERFRAITANYYRNIHGIIVVYDISNQNSFNHLDLWLDEIENNTTGEVCKVLVGNKCDLKHHAVVDPEVAKNLAEDLQIPFLETSVKSNVNVDEAFRKLATQIMQGFERVDILQQNAATIKLDSVPYAKKRRKGCCVKRQTEKPSEDDM